MALNTGELEALRAGELVLEPLVAAHAQAMFEVLRDPSLYRYLDYPPPPSVEHLRGVYERLERRKSPDGVDHWLNWVVRIGEGAPVGFVQATVLANRTAWVAYVIGTAHQRRGVATRATRAMVDHLHLDYGVKRFLASVEADNEPSIRLLERLGFSLASPEVAKGHDLTPSERLYVR
jgi:ribosomal-protein-alanine N-acetyltransferase